MKILNCISYLVFLALNTYAQQPCDCNERLRNLGWYYYTQNRFEEAKDAMKQAIHYKEVESSDTDYYILVLAYIKTDSLNQALDALEEFLNKLDN